MSDELQQRALEVVMQHLGSDADEIETRRDEVWLWLYEGLGWSEAAGVDFEDLVTLVHKAAELDRLRAAGWSETEVSAWEKVVDVRALVESSRPAPGEAFDRRQWVGTLAEAIRCQLEDGPLPHPYLRPIESRLASPRRIKAMLEKLGAPDTCVVGQLETPYQYLNLKHVRPPYFPDEFEAGSRLPLGTALEIAEDSGWEAELYCIPGRLAYVQHHETHSVGSQREVNPVRAIVYRPSR